MPFVGVIVSNAVFRGIPSGNTKKEKIEYYEEGGKKYGVTPCYFRLTDIQPGRKFVYAFVRDQSSFRRRLLPAPTVIHNRTINLSKKARKHVKSLIRDGKYIFNVINRYSKYTIQKLLMKDKGLLPYLPKTVYASAESLQRMMREYRSLIIKPCYSSVGIGIMKLDQVDEHWELSYSSGGALKKINFTREIPTMLKQRFKQHPYIIQERIPLATYNGRPYDIRVSVQRNETGNWQITGMVGKAARTGHFLSNVAQGGTVYRLETLFSENPKLSLEKIKKQIADVSLRIVEHLSKHIPNLADIGLDIGITKDGAPMFIECNCRDLRYSFRNGEMWEEWKSTYTNPIGYASYLLKKIDCSTE